jgi:hypothetical protein
MHLWFAISVALTLFLHADLPRIYSLRSHEQPFVESFPPGENIPAFPTYMSGEPQDQGQPPASSSHKNSTLQESSKLLLIRYVSGEFAKVRRPLPGGKEGIILYVDKPLNQELLDRVIANHGAAVNSGDNAQITKLEFHERTVIVDVNGGGRPKKHWRDHIQIGMGGAPVPQSQSTTTSEDQGPPGMQPGQGGTIYIQFPKTVPDLSPDELKQILTPFLDFSKERSASVHWIDTLPPEMKRAITERHAVLGMDREEVVAAMGKPDRKVRERDPQGNDTEDWIYGHPPDKTIFVRFTGERVSAIKQYPH